MGSLPPRRVAAHSWFAGVEDWTPGGDMTSFGVGDPAGRRRGTQRRRLRPAPSCCCSTPTSPGRSGVVLNRVADDRPRRRPARLGKPGQRAHRPSSTAGRSPRRAPICLAVAVRRRTRSRRAGVRCSTASACCTSTRPSRSPRAPTATCASSPATPAGTPGQLERELEFEMWHVVPRSPRGRRSTPSPDDLWRRVLRRQGGELGLLSTWTSRRTQLSWTRRRSRPRY